MARASLHRSSPRTRRCRSTRRWRSTASAAAHIRIRSRVFYNRRGLEDLLDRELGGAQQNRTELSLVVLDCDDFKDVNDRAGHEFGDALLREVGRVLQRAARRGSAARLGGDEFVVMLPDADADAALERRQAPAGARRRSWTRPASRYG